jgi:hypothetical protein
MTNYDNILDSNSFHAMSTKELIAIGRYINTTKNGENELVEQDFFDAMITRLSDVSVALDAADCRADEARESDEEYSIDCFCEEFSDQANAVGGGLGASMNHALYLIATLRADVRDLEGAIDTATTRNCAPCAPKSNPPF